MNQLPSIEVETSEDESILIATKEQLVTLANTLLQIAESQSTEQSWNGIPVHQESIRLTNSLNSISISTVAIVASEEDQIGAVNYLRSLSGDLPLDMGKH